jgi:hypothetical protein
MSACLYYNYQHSQKTTERTTTATTLAAPSPSTALSPRMRVLELLEDRRGASAGSPTSSFSYCYDPRRP